MSEDDLGAALREACARRLVDERMAHYGYTPKQIKSAAYNVDHYAAGCSLDGSGGWDCLDEYGKSFHPASDEYDQVAEFVCWVLDNHTRPRIVREARHA